MKKIRLSRYLTAGTVICCALVSMSSCDRPGPDTPPEKETPAVGLGSPQPASYSVTFRLTPEHADRVAWIILDGETEAPDAAAVLAEGEAADAQKASSVVADGLEPATDYTIYAAAAKGELLSAVAALKVTTEEEPEEPLGFIALVEAGKRSFTYHIETEEGESYRHMALAQRIFDNYTTLFEGNEAAAAELLLGMYGTTGTGAADYTMTSPAERVPLDVVAGLDYLVVAVKVDAAGAAAAPYEKLPFRTAEPDRSAGNVNVDIVKLSSYACHLFHDVTEEIVVIWETVFFADDYNDLLAQGGEELLKAQLRAIGARVQSFDKAAEWINLEPETDYVYVMFGVDAAGDHTSLGVLPFTTPVPDEIPTEGIVFDRYISALCLGEAGSGAHEFLLSLANVPMEEDPDYGDFYPADGGPGIMLMCDIYAEASSDGRLPEGTYVFSNDSEAGTWNPYDTWAACFDDAGGMVPVEFAGGTIAVAWEGNGYRIEFDLEGVEGEVFTGTYEGEIAFGSYASSARQIRLRPMDDGASRRR